MKKLLLTVILSILLICTVAATVSANGFELNPTVVGKVEPGKSFTVNVTVDSIADGGIESVDFDLFYSSNVKYSTVTATLPTGWDFWTPVTDASARTLRIAAVDEGSTPNPAVNDGAITFSFTFVLNEGVDGGYVTLNFDRVGASSAIDYSFVAGAGNALEHEIVVNKPESLTVTKLPLKTTYTAGQSFFSNGLAIAVVYTDGTTVDVTDFTVEAPDMMTEGVKNVKVTWGTLSTTFEITVNPPLLSGISLVAPTKTSYYVGDSLDKTGMKVIALYANDTSVDVTNQVTVTPSSFTTVGTVTVTVKFSTKSAKFTVTVTEKPASGGDNIAEGTIGSVNWAVSSAGVLTVSGNGEVPNYTRSATAPWYSQNKKITKIVVEDGITRLGDYCFYNLSKATSIEIAPTVKALGVQFIRQTAITEVSLTSDVSIVANAFGRADSLKTLICTEDVKGFLGNIFYQETVTIKAPENSFAHKYAELFATKYATSAAKVSYTSDGTTAKLPIVRFSAAGDNAFFAIYENTKGNWALEVSGTGAMKNFPYVSPKNIAKGYTFSPMYYIGDEEAKINGVEPEAKILSITVKEGITTIGNYIFYKCTKATSVTLPEGITSIGQGAFRLCQRIAKITLPEAVTKIEANAFLSCGKLVEIYIPEGVTTVGAGIFEKCDSINSLVVKTKSAAAIEVISAEYPQVTIVSDF